MASKTHSVTVIAGVALAVNRFVGWSGSYGIASDDVIGVSEIAAEVGRACSCVTHYAWPVLASEAIAAGDWVKPADDGSGRAAVGASTDNCGRALTSASAGQLVDVRLMLQPGGRVLGSVPTLSWRGAGTELAPVWSSAMAAAMGKIGLGQDLLIPAGTLKIGSCIKGSARLRRTGAAQAITTYLTLGPTNGTGDGQIFNYAFATGIADPNRGELNFNVVVVAQGAGAAVRRSQMHNISNVGVVPGLAEVASANFNNSSQDLYLGLIYTVGATSGDTLAMLDYNIVLVR